MAVKPSSHPAWIPDGNPLYATEPTSGKKATGWTTDEEPFFQHMNWLFYIVSQWVSYFETVTDQAFLSGVILRSIAGDYTVPNTAQLVVADCTTGSQVHHLPTVVGNAGMIVRFKKVDATIATVTIQSDISGQLIDGALTQLIDQQYTSLTVACDGTRWNIL